VARLPPLCRNQRKKIFKGRRVLIKLLSYLAVMAVLTLINRSILISYKEILVPRFDDYSKENLEEDVISLMTELVLKLEKEAKREARRANQAGQI
jgi:hypothetical protein